MSADKAAAFGPGALNAPLSPKKEQNTAEKPTLGEDSVIIDSSLETVAVGERIRNTIGSARDGEFIFSLLDGENAFRFEQFVKFAAPFDRMNTIEFDLRRIRGYGHAVACRRELFGRSAVLITFYKNKRERLLKESALFRLAPEAGGGENRLVTKARRLIDELGATRPEEASRLRSVFDDVVRRSLVSEMICNIVTSAGEGGAYDVISLVKNAAQSAGCALSADAAISVSGESEGSAEVAVSPEHLWYLVSAAMTGAIGVSDQNGASLCALTEESAFLLRFVASNAALGDSLPERLTLGELRELFPPSALRLYLCELICEENGIRSEVTCKDGQIALELTIPAAGRERRFHSPEQIAVRPEWVAFTEAVLFPDAV